MQGARLKLGHLLSPLFVGALLAPATAFAADAHQGVNAEPGEIVLLRDVSARHAYRSPPPGMALIVDPSPKSEISMMLGTGELTDAEYASLGAGTAGTRPITTVEQMTSRAIGGSLAGVTSGNGTLSGNGITQSLGVHMGAVGNVTRGIGDQVRGALSQFPLVSPPTNAPPGG